MLGRNAQRIMPFVLVLIHLGFDRGEHRVVVGTGSAFIPGHGDSQLGVASLYGFACSQPQFYRNQVVDIISLERVGVGGAAVK